MRLTEAAIKAAADKGAAELVAAEEAARRLRDFATDAEWQKMWKRVLNPKVGEMSVPDISRTELLTPLGKHPTRLLAVADGIEFVYSNQHNDSGWGVVRTCPECGEKTGRSFHSLDQLGREIVAERERQPVKFHVCYDAVAKRLGLDLQTAAKQTGATIDMLIAAARGHAYGTIR